MLMPHHPDLDLPPATAIACDADTVCSIAAADPVREAIFQRLRAIRRELQTDGPVQDDRALASVFEQHPRIMRASSNRRLIPKQHRD